ncbi:BAH domain, partial [Striga asiatica]
MDSTTSVGRGPNVNNQRRIWTFEEERLKELIARGMKANNGFRSGYTINSFRGLQLERSLTSRRNITVWKKNYVLLAPLLQNTFGVGCHILEVEEPVWNDYGVESSASRKGKRVGKRKRVKDAEVEVVGLLSTSCEKADQCWGQMVERIGVQHDKKEQQKHLRDVEVYSHVENKEEIDVFFSVGEEDKASMVKMILENKLFFHRKINPMDRHESMLRIVARYHHPGWSANEERECYRLSFNICRETPDVNVPSFFNSIWPHLSIQLTKEMLTYFSVLKVKAKIKALHTYFREFLTFLEIPGVEGMRNRVLSM